MKKVNDISFGGCYENLGDISDLDHSFATKFTILNIEDFTMYASLCKIGKRENTKANINSELQSKLGKPYIRKQNN